MKLKKCPFCASNEAMVMLDIDYYNAKHKDKYWVECFKCEAKTAVEDTFESAAMRWNIRLK